MFRILIFSGVILSTIVASAGRQTTYTINHATYQAIKDGGVLVAGVASGEGSANGKVVQGVITTAGVAGLLGDYTCASAVPTCAATFHVVEDKLIANISIDNDQDGNNEVVYTDVIVGHLAPGSSHIVFDLPVRANFIQDRYSFLERIVGATNQDYVHLTLELDR